MNNIVSLMKYGNIIHGLDFVILVNEVKGHLIDLRGVQGKRLKVLSTDNYFSLRKFRFKNSFRRNTADQLHAIINSFQVGPAGKIQVGNFAPLFLDDRQLSVSG